MAKRDYRSEGIAHVRRVLVTRRIQRGVEPWEESGTRNYIFTSPDGRKRIVFRDRVVRSERSCMIDHGHDRFQKVWHLRGSKTHKQYVAFLEAEAAKREGGDHGNA